MLRINRPGERDETLLRSELAWLQALRRDTDLIVPRPIPTGQGDLVVIIPGEAPRYATLFEWIEGRHPTLHPSERSAYLLGEAMARLHDHADTFVPPPGFTTARFDTPWSFGRPAAIWGDESSPLVSADLRRRIVRRAEEIDRTFEALFANPAAMRFLHLDLHVRNVKLRDGRLAILDFDDSLWGYPIQDIGISLFHLSSRSNAERLIAAFRTGYTSVRPWPEGDIDAFVDARGMEYLSLFLTDPVYLPYASHPIAFFERRLQ